MEKGDNVRLIKPLSKLDYKVMGITQIEGIKQWEDFVKTNNLRIKRNSEGTWLSFEGFSK